MLYLHAASKDFDWGPHLVKNGEAMSARVNTPSPSSSLRPIVTESLRAPVKEID